MPVGVEENVLGFDIAAVGKNNTRHERECKKSREEDRVSIRGLPIDDTVLVQVLDRQDELSRVKPGPLLRKYAIPLEMSKQLPAIQVIQDEIELRSGGGTLRTLVGK